jgi:hypothetical protein
MPGKYNEINLFEPEGQASSQIAWACVVYSMVPYLGILFIPAAFAAIGTAFFSSRGWREAAHLLATFFLLIVQLLLWWLLYVIPELSGSR